MINTKNRPTPVEKIGIALVLCSLATTLLAAGCQDDKTPGEQYTVTILQTSDMHNQVNALQPFSDYAPGQTGSGDILGGFARLATVVNEIRAEQEAAGVPVLVIDSGDFTMGTVYDLARTDPVTLALFQHLDYDAITLGNHEFDWGPGALAATIDAAKTAGFAVPILASNSSTSASDAADDDLEALFSDGTIVSDLVLEMDNGLKIGILGLLGANADAVASGALPVTFDHEYDTIQAKIDALKDAGAQLVVLASHGGIIEDGSGEDVGLAKNVSGEHVIASGHEHTHPQEAIEEDGTIIFEPGAYGQWVSRLDLTYDSGTDQIIDYSYVLIPVDDSVAGDQAVIDRLGETHAEINTALEAVPTVMDAPVSTVDFTMDVPGGSESSLGNLAADAVRYAANQVADLNGTDPFDVSVVAGGVIRTGLAPGETGLITFADVYTVLPLGESPAGEHPLPGFPLMSTYVTVGELRNMCEVAQIAPIFKGNDFYLNVSGLRYEYTKANEMNTWVTDLELVPSDDIHTTQTGTALDLTDETTLYRVVVDLYALQLIGVAADLGLPVIPKDVDGNVIMPEDLMLHRIDASSETGVQELKEWMALYNFLMDIYPSDGTGIEESVYGAGGTGMGRATDNT